MSSSYIAKLQHYCAYQERSHSEVKYKCLELGLRGEEVDEAIAALVSENFLNEERFARAFVGGKFRSKQWGRKKILAELKQRQVSAYCIKKGMEEIDADDYEQALTTLATKKYESLRGEESFKRKYKVVQYLMQKGYEPELAQPIVEQIAKDAA
ncbi:regulatory protein [Chitinophaga sp. YR573]|uniref:regulatory protein RecX n=1 Tax=Chitinophaga sp. YR573 TaxID=1881040 RepID=UPI0008C77203|nr:regulatory protein RecX [Chitinophaga sp. YR573]SEW13770.1 regulatory protein [Chitinophaga sp. YR573]